MTQNVENKFLVLISTKIGSLCRFFWNIHFLVAFALKVHPLLKFWLETKIKLTSASGAVWGEIKRAAVANLDPLPSSSPHAVFDKILPCPSCFVDVVCLQRASHNWTVVWMHLNGIEGGIVICEGGGEVDACVCKGQISSVEAREDAKSQIPACTRTKSTDWRSGIPIPPSPSAASVPLLLLAVINQAA